MFTQLFTLMLAQQSSRGLLPWWLWVILIFILLVILWFWFGKEDEAGAEISEPVKEAKVVVGEESGTPAQQDDLKVIEGIGPRVASLLNEAGITTFAQLASLGVEELDSILDAAKLQMMDPATWAEQAKLAAAGEWDALERLQDVLKGGRA